MRNPRGPIPSPAPTAPRAAGYWGRTHPRPPPLPGAPVATPRGLEHLPRLTSDDLGIDRRRHPRGHLPGRDDALDDVVFASHVRFSTLVGLTAAEGSAWARTLSVCPSGLLLHAIDADDLQRDPAHRRALASAMRQLLPAMFGGRVSPLTAAGVTLLSSRFACDLGMWAQADRRTSTAVEVLIAVPGGAPLRWPGRVTRLTDPAPGVLAVALPPEACADLIARATGSR